MKIVLVTALLCVLLAIVALNVYHADVSKMTIPADDKTTVLFATDLRGSKCMCPDGASADTVTYFTTSDGVVLRCKDSNGAYKDATHFNLTNDELRHCPPIPTQEQAAYFDKVAFIISRLMSRMSAMSAVGYVASDTPFPRPAFAPPTCLQRMCPVDDMAALRYIADMRNAAISRMVAERRSKGETPKFMLIVFTDELSESTRGNKTLPVTILRVLQAWNVKVIYVCLTNHVYRWVDQPPYPSADALWVDHDITAITPGRIMDFVGPWHKHGERGGRIAMELLDPELKEVPEIADTIYEMIITYHYASWPLRILMTLRMMFGIQ